MSILFSINKMLIMPIQDVGISLLISEVTLFFIYLQVSISFICLEICSNFLPSLENKMRNLYVLLP